MSADRGDRILGAALLQGKLDWSLLTEALLRREKQPESATEAVRLLLEEGVLDPSDVAGLESTEAGAPSHGGPPATRASEPGHSQAAGPSGKVLTALAIPQWRQYRNLRFVGEGGMGRIYKGFDGTLRRMVALKFLRRMEPHLIARFMQEAQLQGGLEHPNICRVYEVGDWQGQAYIAMQFIKGETLDACAEKLTLRERVEVMEAVASAMHFAHRQGLIHRDLKPANIMVERVEGQPPRPFILDFGLARGLGPSGFTVDGQIVGTYHFMAPEQARGSVNEMDRRTDVYALGATLYAVLADKPPFWEVEGVEVLRKTLNEEPAPLRTLVPDLPEDLETIALKCLEKEPAMRYESARALAEDLRRWLDDEPILARKPTLRYRTVKYVRRHKALVVIAAAALVAVLAFGGIAVGTWATARARARYAQMFGQEAERLEALVRYIHLLPAHDIRGEVRQARARLADLERRAAGAGRLASGPAAYAMGRARLALGEPEAALPLLKKAWDGGLRISEVALALGRAYGQAFHKELGTARMIERPELRAARIRELEQRLRDPALNLLRQGASASLEASAYHEALLEFYEGKWEACVRRAREASNQTAWFYEARHLEGLALLEQAREARERKASMAFLEGATQIFREAQGLAPSDPRLRLDEARAWQGSIIQRLRHAEDPTEDLARVRSAVQDAQRLDPEIPEAPALLAESVRYSVPYRALPRTVAAAWTREHDALSAEALRLGPTHRECLMARARSLHAIFSASYLKDASVLPQLEEAQRLARQGKVLYPEDPAFLVLEGTLAQRQMTYAMYRGLSPWSSFEAGLAATSRIIVLRPQLADGYLWTASLWVERAEYERTHGLDPSASASWALQVLNQAVQRGIRRGEVERSRGNAYLVLGQHRVRQGLGGRKDLDRAIEAFRAAWTTNSNLTYSLLSGAEAALWMGMEAMDQGQSPKPDLALARQLLSGSYNLRQNDYYRLLISGRLALFEAKWEVHCGSSPRAAWGRARSLLRQASLHTTLSITASAEAEEAAWAYQTWGRPEDRDRGMASARRAVAADPSAAEPHLWMALLEREAHRRGTVGSLEGARQYVGEALLRDANLRPMARRMGLPEA